MSPKMEVYWAAETEEDAVEQENDSREFLAMLATELGVQIASISMVRVDPKLEGGLYKGTVTAVCE